jgi:hypothetical protein
LLAEMGYSLQADVKSIESVASHPDRNAQFRNVDDQAAAGGCPVISVDTKKREMVG